MDGMVASNGCPLDVLVLCGIEVWMEREVKLVTIIWTKGDHRIVMTSRAHYVHYMRQQIHFPLCYSQKIAPLSSLPSQQRPFIRNLEWSYLCSVGKRRKKPVLLSSLSLSGHHETAQIVLYCVGVYGVWLMYCTADYLVNTNILKYRFKNLKPSRHYSVAVNFAFVRSWVRYEQPTILTGVLFFRVLSSLTPSKCLQIKPWPTPSAIISFIVSQSELYRPEIK